MLSPAVTALNRDAFVTDDSAEPIIDRQDHRAPSDLDDLALAVGQELDIV